MRILGEEQAAGSNRDFEVGLCLVYSGSSREVREAEGREWWKTRSRKCRSRPNSTLGRCGDLGSSFERDGNPLEVLSREVN